MSIAYIGMGSNLGRRLENLRRAVHLMAGEPEISVVRLSPLYETDPVGGPPQGPFLNAVAALDTGLAPEKLLQALLSIENKLGRLRRERWGPRTLDLDLLLYDRLVLKTPDLIIPHPRMLQRNFVLVPLERLAPDLVIPGTGKTVRQILQGRLPARDVRLYREDWAALPPPAGSI